jgi:hypothetical protein
MKRFGIAFAGVFLASMIAGCGGGLEEGAPKDGPMDPQPQAFKDFMKENGGKMTNVKKPSKASSPAAGSPAPDSTPEKKESP